MLPMLRTRFTFLLATTACIAFLGCGSALIPALAKDAPDKNDETYKNLNLFGDVFERVREDYVEPTTDKDLVEAAINGMLTHLDPHSGYLDDDNFRDMQVQTKGEFGGLGIEVTMDNGLVKVVSPIDDTPAAQAGLQPGDYISHLDGKPVMGLSLAEAVEKMRGPVNTTVKLTIRRGTQEPFEVALTRAVIKIRAVRWKREGDMGYLRVTTFNEKTFDNLKQGIGMLNKESGHPLKGYVLDLRNNPGGLLDQAVAVSDAFLNSGEIVSTRGRNVEETQRFNAEAGDLASGVPLVVLINGGSASASEIVAGALQDHKRAIVLGTQSFGKGSVQTIIPLPGHGAMRLTTALYYTPSGRSIQAKGITPDIEVPVAKVEVLQSQMLTREADLQGALFNAQDRKTPATSAPANPAPAATSPATTPPATPAKPDATAPTPDSLGNPAEDYQLMRALDLLKGITLYEQRVAETRKVSVSK
jgi:carboxyl-terminal processing protease